LLVPTFATWYTAGTVYVFACTFTFVVRAPSTTADAGGGGEADSSS
jgi:hypothetical protein